jgi:hypothetical protein
MPEKLLRRYTTLPSLSYILTEQKLTLLDPQKWDDSNDSYYLQLYREKNHLKSVLALCFAPGPETYHHWSVFAYGPAGGCIQFDRKQLVDALHARPGVRTGKVKYLLLTESRKRRVKVAELPFCKRYAFQHESEFRAIYESKRRTVGSSDITFSLASISRITLSPWLPQALSNHVKETLRAIEGCAKLSIARSTLISNQEWKNLGESAK